MLQEQERGRVILSLIILFSGILLLYYIDTPWDTPSAAISFYSVLAFLCVTMTASAATKIRTDPSPTNRWFIAGTTYAAIVFCGAAVFYSFNNESSVAHTSPSGVFLNLFAFATTGIIIFIFSYIESHQIKKTSILYHRFIYPVTIAIGAILFIVMLITTRVISDQFLFLVAGYFTGIISVIAYVGAGLQMYWMRKSDTVHDSFRLSVSFFLIAGASVNHILILSNPSSLWIISMGLMGIAFLYANVATSYTFLLDVGVRKNLAYGVTIFLSALVVVPFTASRIVTGVFLNATLVDLGARVIIHFAAAIVAGASAYAFHQRIKYRPSPSQVWIIILLIYWTLAELILMISHLLPGYSVGVETVVPYVCGAVLSAIIIPMSVRRTLSPQKGKERNLNQVYGLVIVSTIISIVVGEVLRIQFISILGVDITSAISTAIMLSLSYLSLFAILTSVLLHTSASGGRLSYNSLGAGLVSVWVVITILKVNYDTWTIGWWSAEITLVAAIIVFTLNLVRLFIIDTNRSVEREKRAVAFSNFLSELILGHQVSAIDSLNDISMDITTGDSILGPISNAMSQISRATELSKHIEMFVSGDDFEESQLNPVSLRDSLYSALECAGISSTSDSIRVGEGAKSIELKMEHDCSIQANAFLVDAFQYLLLGIMNRIGSFNSVYINIKELDEPMYMCVCEMNLDVVVEDTENILGLFGRYVSRGSVDAIEIAYSKRIIELFGGSVSFEATISGEKRISVTINIQLMKAHS